MTSADDDHLSEPTGEEEPDYRFTLANERTFLAWIRTALALIAGGIAVVQFAPAFGIPGVRHGLSVALTAAGGLLAALAVRRWQRVQSAMRPPRRYATNPRAVGARWSDLRRDRRGARGAYDLAPSGRLRCPIARRVNPACPLSAPYYLGREALSASWLAARWCCCDSTGPSGPHGRYWRSPRRCSRCWSSGSVTGGRSKSKPTPSSRAESSCSPRKRRFSSSAPRRSFSPRPSSGCSYAQRDRWRPRSIPQPTDSAPVLW